MCRSGKSGYTSENFFRVNCLSDDTPTRTDSPPIFENSSSPGRPATWRFVSAYTSWPSVTMQPDRGDVLLLLDARDDRISAANELPRKAR